MWDYKEWLDSQEKEIKSKGYKGVFNQSFKGESFAYWKNFNDNPVKEPYEIGILFFDFRKQEYNFPDGVFPKIRKQYIVSIKGIGEERCVLNFSNYSDLSLNEIENMAEKFNKSMRSFLIKGK
ncbi:MAG: hypothetical protein ACRDE2_00205 [Chitinophagaceae bacterium]